MEEIMSKLIDPVTPHRYPDGGGFRRFQSSGNHWLIWLVGVAGRFVSNCVRYFSDFNPIGPA
ncbi:MAG: hypothetical protein ABSB74_06560 [Tepidisphaeraceae bacterium]